jgi:hypothetical protein
MTPVRTTPPAPARPLVRGTWRRARIAATAALAALLALPAGAVITTVGDSGSTYSIVLRVGSASGVDNVQFDVNGNNAGLTPAPVTGTPAIDVWVTPARPASLFSSGETRQVTLRVDSSAGLQCQSAGCGLTVIPFSKIRWIASNNSNASSGDIQSGTFDPANTQQAITGPASGFNANATTCFLLIFCNYQSNTINATRMQFIYANDVIYPAGTYKGTVRFTATME